MAARNFLPPRSGPFNPPEILAELRSREPIAWVTLWNGKQVWLVTRYKDVRFVLHDPRFSADAGNPGLPSLSPARVTGAVWPSMRGMDGTRHGELRRMLAEEFTTKRVDELRPSVERIVTTQLDGVLAAAKPVDFHAVFALVVASRVICELLGAPTADAGFFPELTKVLVSRTSTHEQFLAADDELYAYCGRLVTRKKKEPTDDLLGRLVIRELRTGRLSHDELCLIAKMLILAGHETTANMISLATLTLLLTPGWFQAMCATPEAALNAVEELFRYHTLMHVGLPRVATEDVLVGGTAICAGDGVVVSLASGNRDDAVFDSPNELKIGRNGNRHHLTFGHGAHQCLGMWLARAELQIALCALAARMPTLQLAVPFSNISFKEDMHIYGVHKLPVTW